MMLIYIGPPGCGPLISLYMRGGLMGNAVREIIRDVFRLLTLWLVASLSMAAAALMIPGISFTATADMPRWAIVVISVFMLTVANFLIRPIVVLVARPLGWIALLAIGFPLDAAALDAGYDAIADDLSIGPVSGTARRANPAVRLLEGALGPVRVPSAGA
ncbi:MAG TPA: hypothetical protein ENO08_03155, partial [Candidatus Eisenbacteria bacterium]|nr:hypothetical protein [Candidatus Eisenbacteria bacterium]